MTAPTPGRVIPGASIRHARTETAASADRLAALDCATRVTVVLGFLLAGPDGTFLGADLYAAMTEQDTVDLALDVLTDAGVGCNA